MCRRRLAREHTGGKRHANRIGRRPLRGLEPARRPTPGSRTPSSGRRAPRRSSSPSDLEPEQRALYRAAVRGYLDEFGDRPGRAADLGWQTAPRPSSASTSSADPGIALELPDGRRELRVLQLGGRRAGAPLLDPVELRVALVRTEEWAPDQLDDRRRRPHRTGDCVATRPDLAAERAEAARWISERVELVKELAADGRARGGADCTGCPFIAGCDAVP